MAGHRTRTVPPKGRPPTPKPEQGGYVGRTNPPKIAAEGGYVGVKPPTNKSNPPRIPARGGHVGRKPRTISPKGQPFPVPTPDDDVPDSIWQRRYNVAREDVGDLVEALLRIEATPHGDECPTSNYKYSTRCDCHKNIARLAIDKVGK